MIVTIQHISLCDLMMTGTNAVLTFDSVIRYWICNEWILGNFLCHLTTYTEYHSLVASMLLICNMTTSKLLSLKYHLRLKTVRVKKGRMICGACQLAALIAPVTFHLDGEDETLTFRTSSDFTSNTWDWLRSLIVLQQSYQGSLQIVQLQPVQLIC